MVHTQILNGKNMEFAMLSRLFYTRTVHRKPSSKAHSNVAYGVAWRLDQNAIVVLTVPTPTT